jgi:hypothetical protein
MKVVIYGSRDFTLAVGCPDSNHSPPRYVFPLGARGPHMDTPYTAPRAPVADQAVEASKSAVSWAAIFAGAAVAISISLVLLTLGSGLGLASLTPSARSAVSPGGLAALVTIWIVVVQWLSAASGGYVTGRLRTRWVGTHTHEVFFRDTAHGFVTWAVATAIVAMVVASATSSMLGGGIHAAPTMASVTTQGAASSAQNGSVAQYDIDVLFRNTLGDANSPSDNSASTEGRGEATRILANGLSTGGVPDADRRYLVSLIAARTGVLQADAQKRVDDVVARARQEAEAARKAAARTSLLTALAMMIGAFVACAAAALGGHERDRHP